MDPNATLEQARLLFERAQEAETNEERIVAGFEAAELYAVLDGWITSGGFLPTDWS